MGEEEVEKAKRQIAAHVAYERDGTHNVAMQMSEAESVADWRFYEDYPRNVERVTAEDVRRVAARYLREDARTVGHFIPKNERRRDGQRKCSNGSKARAVEARARAARPQVSSRPAVATGV